jgi:hypothetical protein
MKKYLTVSSLARIIAAGLLFYALKRHAYDYYTLLRWVTFGVGLYSAIIAFKDEKTGWAAILGMLALLFNPLIPVHLKRETWAIIDVAAGVLLLASIPFVQARLFSAQNSTLGRRKDYGSER